VTPAPPHVRIALPNLIENDTRTSIG
jgi:hypothetical protein